MVHVDNVDHILSHGMFTRHHPLADPGYINIGDWNLIGQRNDHPVDIDPPNGTLGEYIPFYFGPLSPMLYNIMTGYRGIIQRPQDEIVYMGCRVSTLVEHCGEWSFTDGHAKNAISRFYNDLASLGQVDWSIVGERHWRNTDDDYDRIRRKQAEFLVKHHVPLQCIGGIIVFNDERKKFVDSIVVKLGLTIPVLINPNFQFYY
jgi:hypothetical protein